MIPYSRPKLSDFYTLFESKLAENHTLHSGTYLYSSYMGVPLPPDVALRDKFQSDVLNPFVLICGYLLYLTTLQCSPNNKSLSCILNFKPLFVMILLCFSLSSFPFSPRGRFVLQTEISGKFQKFIIYFSCFSLFVYFLPLPPLGSVCRLYFTFKSHSY